MFRRKRTMIDTPCPQLDAMQEKCVCRHQEDEYANDELERDLSNDHMCIWRWHTWAVAPATVDRTDKALPPKNWTTSVIPSRWMMKRSNRLNAAFFPPLITSTKLWPVWFICDPVPDEFSLFIGGTRRFIALRAVVEFERLATKSSVDPVRAIMIKMIGNITTRTKNTRRNAAIAERELFSRHRFINGLKETEENVSMVRSSFFFHRLLRFLCSACSTTIPMTWRGHTSSLFSCFSNRDPHENKADRRKSRAEEKEDFSDQNLHRVWVSSLPSLTNTGSR